MCLPNPGPYRDHQITFFYKQGALSPALTFAWLEANLVFEVVNCFAEYLDRPELTAHDDFIVPEESA